jgi:hypothetical protein
MPRPSVRARAWLLVAALVVLALGSVAAPAVVLGRGSTDLSAPTIHEAAVPGDERCADASPDPDTGQKICEEPILSAANLGPILAGVVGAGILALVVAFLVLRRRASVPLPALDPNEWWKCANCGATNVVGSARCYACGTWQR